MANTASGAAKPQPSGEPQASPERVKAPVVPVGGGLLLSEDAVFLTVYRRALGSGDRWEQCTVFNAAERVHIDQFPAWKDPAPPPEGSRRPEDAAITIPVILATWGAGTYRLTQHGRTGSLVSKSREMELGAPGDPRGPARAGVPEPAPAAPPPAVANPAPAPPVPEGLGSMSGAQLFVVLNWAEERAAARHDREIDRMRMRHQLDMQESAQRHRDMLEHQASTLNQALAFRRPNPDPELLARFERLEGSLVELLNRDDDAGDDDEPGDADREPDDSIAGQIERLTPLVLGVAEQVIPLFRPQTSLVHGAQGFATPPAWPAAVPNPERRPRRQRVEPEIVDVPPPAEQDEDDDDQDDDDDSPESSDGHVSPAG